VGVRDSLDDMEYRKFSTLPELELRPLGRPVRSNSLYRVNFIIYLECSVRLRVGNRKETVAKYSTVASRKRFTKSDDNSHSISIMKHKNETLGIV
jgi:hypothetical protein